VSVFGTSSITSSSGVIVSPISTGLRKRDDCSTKATIEPSSSGDRVEAPTGSHAVTSKPVCDAFAEASGLGVFIIVVDRVIVASHSERKNRK